MLKKAGIALAATICGLVIFQAFVRALHDIGQISHTAQTVTYPGAAVIVFLLYAGSSRLSVRILVSVLWVIAIPALGSYKFYRHYTEVKT